MTRRTPVAMLVCALGLGCVFTSRPQLPGSDNARDVDGGTGVLTGHDAAAAFDVAAPPTGTPDASAADAPVDDRDASPCDNAPHDLDAGDAAAVRDASDASDGSDAGDADDAPPPRCDVVHDGVTASVGGR